MNNKELSELDLTNSHLPSLEQVPLTNHLTVLDLTANRLKRLEPKLLALSGLRRLSLRQNLLVDAAPLSSLTGASALEELVLHTNLLTQVPLLPGFSSLRILDLSFNEIRTMDPLTSYTSRKLKELYLANNKITIIQGLEEFEELSLLELGANRISVIGGLEHQASLQQLWLGGNRIEKAANLTSLTNLQKVSLQSNRLRSMVGFEACVQLRELYLSHNGIRQIEGLATLTQLRLLDLSNNQISEVAGLEAQSCLEDLWLNDNAITSLEGLPAALSACQATLTCVYMAENPATKGNSQYAATMRALLPNLTQLDADYLKPLS